MNEENYTCEICYENYDLKNPSKRPMQVPCCNKTFCLSCLNDIFKRNNQTLKCPNCRKITYSSPINYKINNLIYSRFLICCNCHEKVQQNELYFCKDDNNKVLIKCQNCENGDMKLNDILPDFIAEINKNIKEYENFINNSIIEVIKNEIKNEIEEYIYNIKINLIESITNKILEEINQTWKIEKIENDFKNMVKELKKNNKYLNDFREDIPTKNFDSKQILNCMQFYNDNICKIKNEFKFLGKFRDLINKNSLIGIHQNFNIDKLGKYFVFLVDKNNKDNKNYEKNKNNDLNKYNKKDDNIKDLEKSNFNLIQNDDNNFFNDKMLLELDKLVIKPKFEYNLSVNAQRI